MRNPVRDGGRGRQVCVCVFVYVKWTPTDGKR